MAQLSQECKQPNVRRMPSSKSSHPDHRALKLVVGVHPVGNDTKEDSVVGRAPHIESKVNFTSTLSEAACKTLLRMIKLF